MVVPVMVVVPPLIFTGRRIIMMQLAARSRHANGMIVMQTAPQQDMQGECGGGEIGEDRTHDISEELLLATSSFTAKTSSWVASTTLPDSLHYLVKTTTVPALSPPF